MMQKSFVATVRSKKRVGRYASIVLLLVGIIIVSTIALQAPRVPGALVAPWWPAAALATIAMMLTRGRGIVVATSIAAVTFAVNFIDGASLGMAIIFGMLNAVEAYVVAKIARSGPADPDGSVFGPSRSTRFVLGAVAGATIAGVTAGLAASFSQGVLITGIGLAVAISHLSANLLIVPLAIVPATAFRIRWSGELAAQVASLLAVFYVVFGLDFHAEVAVFPMISWLVFRFSTGLVLIEVVLIATSTFVLSLLGFGPFVDDGHGPFWVPIVQIFVIAIAMTALVASSHLNERNAVLLRSRAREALLRGGLLGADAGFFIVERDEEGDLVVVESNPAGQDLLREFVETSSDDTISRVIPGTLLSERIDQTLAGVGEWTGSVTAADDRIIQLQLRRLDDGSRPATTVEAVDATERMREKAALQRAVENERRSSAELLELNRQKDLFLATVSHELRTPISSIIGYSEMLIDDELPAHVRSQIEVIARNADKLGDLIKDLVAASKSQQTEVRPSQTDLRRVMRQAIEALKPHALQRQISVEWNGPAEGSPTVIVTDPVQLEHIVTNLLSNAIKYGFVGSVVSVGLTITPGDAVITVTNVGHPIESDELTRVFERFYRTPQAAADAVPGVGLGLSIALSMSHNLGARLSLDSVSDGTTTAKLVLPLMLT